MVRLAIKVCILRKQEIRGRTTYVACVRACVCCECFACKCCKLRHSAQGLTFLSTAAFAGQKIVVITNTPQRREPPALPAVAPPASQQSSVWPVTSGHSASDSGQQQQPPQQQQQPPQTVGMPAAAVGSGSAGEATLYVPIPSPSSGSASEVGEDGYQVSPCPCDSKCVLFAFEPITPHAMHPALSPNHLPGWSVPTVM